jgi:peptidoglycan biosynthesis protein MviN/MurJ (putative lipid II flippase)
MSAATTGNAMKRESFLHSLGAAALWRGLDRVAGLAKHILIAAAIGLSAQLDVFYMAVAILGVLVFSWAHLLDVLAVPQLVKASQAGDQATFQSLAGGLFILCLLASLLIASLFYGLRDWIAALAPGFDAKRNAMLVDALAWLAPVALLYIPLRMLGSIARSVRRFTLFYQAEFLTSLVVLTCVLVSDDPHVLLWAFGLGVSVAFFFSWRRCAAISSHGDIRSVRPSAPACTWLPAC